MDNNYDTFDYVVIILFIVIIFAVIFVFITVEVNIYEYIDLDGNKGTAKECSYEFQGYYSGGQGSPVCVLEDGTVIQVKQYKLIDSKTCLAGDINCLDKKDVE